MDWLSRPYHFKFFKGFLPQVLYGQFLNTLIQMVFYFQLLPFPTVFQKSCCKNTWAAVSLFNKVATYSLQHFFFKQRQTQPQTFFYEFCEIFTKTSFKKTPSDNCFYILLQLNNVLSKSSSRTVQNYTDHFHHTILQLSSKVHEKSFILMETFHAWHHTFKWDCFLRFLEFWLHLKLYIQK